MYQLLEKQGDLFASQETNSLAHCVSEDLSMSKGIAVIFKNKFKGVAELKQQGRTPGEVAVLQHGSRYIYYLITKVRYFHKPTYSTLESSLNMMKQHCIDNGVKHLAMPRIGCGLDGLEWTKVKEIINSVFVDVEITITIYSL